MPNQAELSRPTDPSLESEAKFVKAKPTSRRLGGLAGKGVAVAFAISTLAGCNNEAGAVGPNPRPTISNEPTPIVTQIPNTESPSPSGTEIVIPSASPSSNPTESPSPSPTETLSPEEKLLTPHLDDVAKKAGITRIGVEFTGNDYQRPDWANLATEQFNSVTLDWGLDDWATVEPSKGNFNFSIIDQQLPFLEANNLAIRGHSLVDVGGGSPQWLKDGHYSKAELKDILINHVKTIVSRYKGVISEWVVVNEPYLNPYRTDDVFYNAFGYNYIDMAFKAAREADPSAKLIYNDTENHRSDSGALTTSLTQETVKRLKSEGLIDMVGLEMHVDAGFHTTRQDMINVMRSYGVPVAITEFDIDLNTLKGTTAQRFALQAQLATDAVSACRESKVCKEITFWGIGDNSSWLEVAMGEKNADPTMFDNNLKPKPYYFAVRKALS